MYGRNSTMKTRERMKKMIVSALMTGVLCAGSVVGWAADAPNVPPPPPPADAAPGPGPGQGRPFGPQRDFLKQVLRLSDSQDAKLRELRRASFNEAAPLHRELFRLRQELATESVRKKVDDKRIAELSRQIGQEHEKLALLQSRHLKALAGVLDKKQLETFLKLKESHPFGRNWGHGMR